MHLSDPHIGATWGGGDPVGGVEATVEAVRRLPDRPDAVVISGDLADTAADGEYELVRELVARLGAPLHVLPGNHDDRDGLRRCFGVPGRAGTPVQYSAELGPLRLVMLVSTRPGEVRGELDRERLMWLDAELTAAPDRPTLLAMHHPPLATGSKAWDQKGLPATDRGALAEVVRRHSQVRRIVAGHVHRTIAGELDGRAVLAIPSTYVQAQFDLASSEMELSDDPPAFVLHTLVDGDLASHLQPVVMGSRAPL